jgi:hypothetical protein
MSGKQSTSAMTVVEEGQGRPIVGVQMPQDFYWILAQPTPLAGMRYPAASFPWSNLHAVGFCQVVSLHPGPYDPAPLTKVFSEHLEDLVGGGPPRDDVQEREKIRAAGRHETLGRLGVVNNNLCVLMKSTSPSRRVRHAKQTDATPIGAGAGNAFL